MAIVQSLREIYQKYLQGEHGFNAHSSHKPSNPKCWVKTSITPCYDDAFYNWYTSLVLRHYLFKQSKWQAYERFHFEDKRYFDPITPKK